MSTFENLLIILVIKMPDAYLQLPATFDVDGTEQLTAPLKLTAEGDHYILATSGSGSGGGGGGVVVTGGLTNTELRASPVPVVADTGLLQPITNVELRAAPIAVTLAGSTTSQQLSIPLHQETVIPAGFNSNSASDWLVCDGYSSFELLLYSGGSTTKSPSIQLQGSYSNTETLPINLGHILVGAAGLTVSTTVTDVLPKKVRFVTLDAGTNVTNARIILRAWQSSSQLANFGNLVGGGGGSGGDATAAKQDEQTVVLEQIATSIAAHSPTSSIPYSYAYINTPGVHNIATYIPGGLNMVGTIHVSGGFAGTVKVYDSLTDAGTVILDVDATNNAEFALNCRFSVGITIVTSAASKLTVTFVSTLL